MRVVPRRVFQAIAMPLLLAVWALAAQLAWSDLPPVAWIVDLWGRPIGWLVTWIGATLGWAVALLPLRLISDFPTYRETLDRAGARDLSEMLQIEQRKQRAMAAGTPAERRRYHLLFASAALLVGVVLGVVATLNLAIAPDTFLLVPALGSAACLVIAPWHLLRAAVRR
jgi:Flp pilus assembly protein TadB